VINYARNVGASAPNARWEARERAINMTHSLATLPLEQLKRAVDIREQIDLLTLELHQLLASVPRPEGMGNNTGNGSAAEKKRVLTQAGRARIAAAQRLRWAKYNATRGGRPRRTTRHDLSPEGRARVSAAVKARWVRFRAAKARAALASAA